MENEQFEKDMELTKEVCGIFGERVKSIVDELTGLNRENPRLFNMSLNYVIHNIITPLDTDSRNKLLDKLKDTMNTLDAMGWPEPTLETLKEFWERKSKKQIPDYIG